MGRPLTSPTDGGRRGRYRTVGLVLTTLLVVTVPGPYLLPLPGSDGIDLDQFAPADAHFVEVDGGRVHFRLDGPADGPPVVLVHGLGGSAFSWRLTRRQLADAGFRTLAVDLRGFGLSDKSFDADHSRAAQARVVAEVMEALGMSASAVVGHSMGAGVAAHLALERPDLVERLVLVAAWLPDDAVVPWPGQLLDVPPVARWGRLIVRTLATPNLVTMVLRTLYDDPNDIEQALVAGHLVPLGVRGWDQAVLAVVRDVGRSEWPAPLATISMPTLIVWGTHDPWLSVRRAPELRDAIPGARLTLIDGAGHLPFEETPGEFMDAILPFLGSPPTTSAR
jgi:pimeloyl-ACP methyl ester carboxylesterase